MTERERYLRGMYSGVKAVGVRRRIAEMHDDKWIEYDTRSPHVEREIVEGPEIEVGEVISADWQAEMTDDNLTLPCTRDTL